jgi:nitrogen PTS system EIIA component
MTLPENFNKSAILVDIKSKDKNGILKELAKLLSNAYEELSKDKIYSLLLAREELCSTAIDGGLAIPHAKTGEFKNLYGAFARSVKGVDFGAMDNSKTHLFFVLISPENSAGEHLMALAHISRLFQEKKFRKQILKVESKNEIWNLLTKE